MSLNHDCPLKCVPSPDCYRNCGLSPRCKLLKSFVASLPVSETEFSDTMKVDLSYLNSVPAGRLPSAESEYLRTVFGRNQRVIAQSLQQYIEPSKKRLTSRFGERYWTSLTLIGLVSALLLSAITPHIPLSIDLYHLPLLGSTRMHSQVQP